jgi:hypothetical protein
LKDVSLLEVKPAKLLKSQTLDVIGMVSVEDVIHQSFLDFRLRHKSIKDLEYIFTLALQEKKRRGGGDSNDTYLNKRATKILYGNLR